MVERTSAGYLGGGKGGVHFGHGQWLPFSLPQVVFPSKGSGTVLGRHPKLFRGANLERTVPITEGGRAFVLRTIVNTLCPGELWEEKMAAADPQELGETLVSFGPRP